MRFDELVLRIPGDEFRIRFHEQLTVLSGLAMLERQAIAESVIGAVTGTDESAVLSVVDGSGRPMRIVAGGGRALCTYVDDGSPAPSMLGTLAPDADELRTLMLVQAGDLGLNATRGRSDDPPELSEARATLSSLTDELHAAIAGRQSLEQIREELARVEGKIRQAADGSAQREYARVLSDLERVRSEAAALHSGQTGVETDRHLLGSAPGVRQLADRWREASLALAELLAAFGQQPRLDPEEVGRTRFIPDGPPSELPRLLMDLETASGERDRLDTRLRELAAARLPDPSDPRVVDLATVNQRELWTTRQLVVESARRIQHEHLMLGGIDASDEPDDAVVVLEAAHHTVEDAEALVRRRVVPTVAGSGTAAAASLLALAIVPALALPLAGVGFVTAAVGLGVPRRRLAHARKREGTALEGPGAPTYLSFHLRRVDAVLDRSVRQRLDAAVLEHRAAVAAWHQLAHGIELDDASALETEVRAYAAALAGMGGAADEIEDIRRELVDQADPALAAARQALGAACGAYGLEPADVADADAAGLTKLLNHQVATGRAARLQDEIEMAEAEEEKLGNRLDDVLTQLGFRDGELESRSGALDWAAGRAQEREVARARARTREAIEEDLERLQGEARRLRRPEWASITPTDALEPDLDSLHRRRDDLHAAIAGNPGSTVDVDRLADRHSAMERRVAALESRLGSGHSESTVAQLADVHQYLLAHLTKAGHVGPRDESVPVLLDEVFLRVAAERKWELLDLLRRLGEKTQLVYLTDDPFVTAWARRRAAAGLITLLEPVADPV